jgi:hypothetical protein
VGKLCVASLIKQASFSIFLNVTKTTFMKRTLAAVLVGAIIVFGWQALSWMLLPFHNDSYKYTPNEQVILNNLSSSITEEGTYMLPGTKPGVSQEEQAKTWEANKGKPWAMVTYHPSYSGDMAGQMIRGFLIALVSVWIVCWLLKGINGFSNIFIRSLMIGFFAWLFVHYNNHNWFATPWSVLKGELIDILAAWGLCGLWLGWWLNRGAKRY